MVKIKGEEVIMRFFFVLLLATACAASSAWAAPYGNYDARRILSATETPAGKRHGIDLQYLDTMLDDIASHARNYPPAFDSDQDRQRATRDAATLAGMLGLLTQDAGAQAEILFRAAMVNSYGHNLNIAGTAEKANLLFQRLLSIAPDHPRSNHAYGVFLAGVAKPRESLPYLEKALAAGIVDAGYALGLVHLGMGDQARALHYLESYKASAPDPQVAALIEAIRSAKVTVRRENQ
jgi:Tfp pilus assembly protein PilF